MVALILGNIIQEFNKTIGPTGDWVRCEKEGPLTSAIMQAGSLPAVSHFYQFRVQ